MARNGAEVLRKEQDMWSMIVEAAIYGNPGCFTRLHVEVCEESECGCPAFILRAARSYARAHAEAHIYRKNRARRIVETAQGRGRNGKRRAN